MPDPADPGKRRADYDWRTEVDWPQVRRLVRWHALYWVFGLLQVALFWAGFLMGATRTLIGVADYVAWFALLVMSFRIISRHPHRGSTLAVSPPTFLILCAFIASLCAYIVLLSLIGLGTVTIG